MRFVKVVATSIVQGLLQQADRPSAVGAEAGRRRPERGAAHQAERHDDGGRHLAARHLSGAAEVRAAQAAVDLIKGDIVFVGEPEPKGADKESDAAAPPSKP